MSTWAPLRMRSPIDELPESNFQEHEREHGAGCAGRRPGETGVRFWLVQMAGWLPLPVLHAVGWLAGTLMAWIPNSQRETARQQIDLCLPELPESARRSLARRSLIETAKAVVEAPAFWFGPLWRVRRWIRDEAFVAEIRRRADATGGAAIILTPHLGAWELSSICGAQAGPVTVLYKPQNRGNRFLNALMERGRTRSSNIALAPTDAGGVRILLAALRRHEHIGILPDHDPPEGSGSFAPLFGQPAHTMDLVTKLAERTGAAVMYVVCERLSWARGFRFYCLDAPAGIADPQQGPASLNQGLEQCIRRWPGQYWWGYKRFRRLPPGVESPYGDS